MRFYIHIEKEEKPLTEAALVSTLLEILPRLDIQTGPPRQTVSTLLEILPLVCFVLLGF